MKTGVNTAPFPRGPCDRMSKVHQGGFEGIKRENKVRSLSSSRKLSWETQLGAKSMCKNC